ncbi:uncharacterized protein LOC113312031 [Papaver somniferum]|uniref:uncharacterized protein LOC113312031 n=1 Tax=Papaver somniferum TaxID=3469 RepID=UPI000E70413C|nr:uncharacterized protein LOC113312031 [Papaver somniferum]
MGPQRRLGFYVGFDSSSVIRFLEPLTGDIFKARFADCHFDESNFPSLGGQKLKLEERREISWNTPSIAHLDPLTSQCELEFQRIINLKNIANRMSDAFTDTARVIVSAGQNDVSEPRLKTARPIGAKDSVPWKKGKDVGIPENTTSTKSMIYESEIIAHQEEEIPGNK